jgi:alpha-glucosidase
MAAAALNGSKPLSPQAPPSPACGAKTGRACAKPALAAACSGIGVAISSVIRSARANCRAQARGIRFLAYANPYLAADGILYEEAEPTRAISACGPTEDEPYLVDFGEFDCGVLDFTRAETRDWFAEKVLGREMLDMGIDGLDGRFRRISAHRCAACMMVPIRWRRIIAGRCCGRRSTRQAVASRGKTGDALFFMRAGFSGVQAHCPLLWAGDQSVDFTRHDGIGTVITAALSAGLVGNAYSHSDCGGYTSSMAMCAPPN